MEETNLGKEEEKQAMTTSLPAAAAVPAAPRFFTDDLIVEILSRLPARSAHRFKCVSPSWSDLIADPAHRKKLPQILAGFLYDTYNRVNSGFHKFHFASVSAIAAPPVNPSLPFLPPDEYLYVAQLDTCNGLLLCLAHMAPPPSSSHDVDLECHYIVCNPATGRWVDLPSQPKMLARTTARLAFDHAVSSHFHVLEFEKTEWGEYITEVNIYSSLTGSWNHRECRSVEKFCPYTGVTSVFFHGMLYLLSWLHPMSHGAPPALVAVDMEGQVRETIRVPAAGVHSGVIGLSQGCLHYATTSSLGAFDKNSNKEITSQDTKVASVWYMKDYYSKEWVLKHSHELPSITAVNYKVAAIHPDCDTIFLDSFDVDTLSSYDMQRRKFHHVLQLKKIKASQFLPYVPLFSDSLAGADGQ